MRILHITECYEGGVSRAMNSITVAAPSHEHFLVYSGTDSPAENFTGASRLPEGFIQRCKALKEAVDTLNPDIVHAHSSWAGVYSRVQGLGVPVVYQPHCYASEMSSGLKAAIFYAAERVLGGRTAGVAVLSPREQFLANRLSPNARHVRVPNTPSLNEKLFQEKVDSREIVLMIGRICKQKDPIHFAEVAREVKRLDPTIHFVWAGDGDYAPGRDALQDAGVQITGWLDALNLADIISAADVYYHSASYEGFPLSVLDAAQGSLPILTRDIPAFEGSALIQTGTVSHAATEILRILEDEEYRYEVSSMSVDLLESMSAEAQQIGLSELYRLDDSSDVRV